MASQAVRRKRQRLRSWESKLLSQYARSSTWPELQRLNAAIMAEGFPKEIRLPWPAWSRAFAQMHELCRRTRRVMLVPPGDEVGFMYMGCHIFPEE